jgi:pyridoxal 5'-phosphate synthase pdxT subunit
VTVRIGVMALQGDFALHLALLRRAGAEGVEVRRPDQLTRTDGLILPGGESTTLVRLLVSSGLESAIPDYVAAGRPVMGTCAGMILLAREVLDPPQPSLGLLDAVVRRNAYGRQVDSFEADAPFPALEDDAPVRMVFIRAPAIEQMGPSIETLMTHEGKPVLVRQGNILAAAFHPEMTDDPRVHAYFMRMASTA